MWESRSSRLSKPGSRTSRALRLSRASKASRFLNSRISRQLYDIHLSHLDSTKSVVDDVPPRFVPQSMADVDQLLTDARTHMQRTRENIQLLLQISRIMRTEGLVRPFRPNYPYVKSMRALYLQNQVQEMQRQNCEFGQRLQAVKPRYNVTFEKTKETPTQQREAARCQRLISDFNNQKSEIFEKYDGWKVDVPTSVAECCRLLRPRVLLHLAVQDGRPLGTITLELYTEAAPLIVLEFVRQCSFGNYAVFDIRRIFPDLWIECNLHVSNLKMVPTNQPLEYDMRVVDHGRHPYVLSFARNFVMGFPQGMINFTINFKKLVASNGRRVGFGRIISGDKIIDCLQGYGTKNGKISKNIVVTGCSVY